MAFKMKRKIRDFYLIDQIILVIFLNNSKEGFLMTGYLLSKKVQGGY